MPLQPIGVFSKIDPTGDLKRMLTCGVIVQIYTSQGSQGGVEGLILTLIKSPSERRIDPKAGGTGQ
jgi:hypothetical protein